MKTSGKAEHYGSWMMRALVFAAFALCGMAPANAQEIVKGTFTLNSETHFGPNVLPAGNYILSIEPLTSLTAAGGRVFVFVRPESKSGPVASVFAMASQQGCDTPSGLTLLSEGSGMTARSLCLGKQGIMVDFDHSRATETPKVALTSTQQ